MGSSTIQTALQISIISLIRERRYNALTCRPTGVADDRSNCIAAADNSGSREWWNGRFYCRYRCYTRRDASARRFTYVAETTDEPGAPSRPAGGWSRVRANLLRRILQDQCGSRFSVRFPGPEATTGVLSMMFSTPGFYCVVAEHEGRIVGSNCLDERSVIAGVGPITIDPGAQNLGIGRRLMQAVMDRANEQRARNPAGTGRVSQPLALALCWPWLRYPGASCLHAGTNGATELCRMCRATGRARRSWMLAMP